MNRTLTAIAMWSGNAALLCGCAHWSESELAGHPQVCEADQASDIRVVTFNAHHLNDSRRVAAYVSALHRTAAMLGSEDVSADLIGMQEVESAEALGALVSTLTATFDVRNCQCAPGHWVLAAVKRERFEVQGSRCIGFGSMLIDHARCAVSVRAIDRVNHSPLSFIALHGAWHWNNTPNGEILLASLTENESERTIIAGDYNTQAGRGMRRPLERAGFVDAGDGDGPTHATGWRLDAVLHARQWRSVCRTNARELFNWVHPVDSDRVLCEHGECSLSDHLPVGARLRWQSAHARQ